MPYNEAAIAGKETADIHLQGDGVLISALLDLLAAASGDGAEGREIDGRLLADIRELPLEAVHDSLLADARRAGFHDVAAVLAA